MALAEHHGAFDLPVSDALQYGFKNAVLLGLEEVLGC
jgi:hypothetical protein